MERKYCTNEIIHDDNNMIKSNFIYFIFTGEKKIFLLCKLSVVFLELNENHLKNAEIEFPNYSIKYLHRLIE